MGFMFRTKLSAPICYEDLFALPGFKNLRSPMLGFDQLRGVWPEGRFVHVYEPDESTRVIELGPESGDFTVRLLTGASESDCRTGRKLIAAVSVVLGADIQGNDGQSCPLQRLEDVFDRSWVRRVVISDTISILEQAEGVSEGEWVSVQGTLRPICIGLTQAKTLRDAAESDLDLARRLHALMRRVLYPGDDVVAAELVEFDSTFTAAKWVPDRPHILPKADYVMLASETAIYVPFDAFDEVIADVERKQIDGFWSLVPAVDPTKWELTMRRAKRAAVDPRTDQNAKSSHPEGTLLPVLRDQNWVHRGRALTDTLVPNVNGSPLLSWVFDAPKTMVFVPTAGFDERTANRQWLRSEGLKNLAAAEFEWSEHREEGDGHLKSLTFIGEFAAETLLVKERLLAAHERLGSGDLWLSAPIGGIVRADKAEPENRDKLVNMIDWTQLCYEDAEERREGRLISPLVFLIRDGELAGAVG